MNTLGKLIVAIALFVPVSALAADHQVRMKGSGTQSMDFEPAFLRIAPGDTVTFLPDAAGHNVGSIDGMSPAGAEPWVSSIDQQVTVTFNIEGLHGYQCPPHLETGMVGLIQVGDASPGFDPAKGIADLPDKARTYMKVLLKKAGITFH